LAGNRRQLATSTIDLLEAPLAESGYSLLDVRVFQGGGRVTLRIYVDTEDGISVDECAKASRTVAMLLEESSLVDDAYVIEVTSPGVRRPLRTREHYEAAQGQDVILKLMATGGTKKLKGLLRGVTDVGLTVVITESDAETGDEVERTVGYEMILEGNLDPELDVQALINADRRRRKDEKKLARQKRRDQKRRPRK
jgi:ribosome maturation factor RimP